MNEESLKKLTELSDLMGTIKVTYTLLEQIHKFAVEFGYKGARHLNSICEFVELEIVKTLADGKLDQEDEE